MLLRLVILLFCGCEHGPVNGWLACVFCVWRAGRDQRRQKTRSEWVDGSGGTHGVMAEMEVVALRIQPLQTET